MKVEGYGGLARGVQLIIPFFLVVLSVLFLKPPTWMQTPKACINYDDDEFGQGFNPSQCIKASVVLPWTLYLLEQSFVIFYLISN